MYEPGTPSESLRVPRREFLERFCANYPVRVRNIICSGSKKANARADAGQLKVHHASAHISSSVVRRLSCSRLSSATRGATAGPFNVSADRARRWRWPWHHRRLKYPDNLCAALPWRHCRCSSRNPGAADHCLLASPSGDFTGSVQARRVKAILTTEDGQRYFVDLDCQKQYGWCAPLGDHATYMGKLSEQPKSLSNYKIARCRLHENIAASEWKKESDLYHLLCDKTGPSESASRFEPSLTLVSFAMTT